MLRMEEQKDRELPYGKVEALDHCLQMSVFGLIVTQAKAVLKIVIKMLKKHIKQIKRQ